MHCPFKYALCVLIGQYGQLGHGTEHSTDEPTPVDYFSSHSLSVKDVVCGSWNTFVSVVPKETSSVLTETHPGLLN